MRFGSLRWVLSRSVWVISLAAALLVPPALAQGAVALPPRAPGDSLSYSLEPYPYRIAPGDELDVDFGLLLESRPITAHAVVRPDGVISLPHIGDVLVAGLSTAELDTLLAGRYADIFVNPSITVAVTKMAGNLVHVLGEVRLPGSYEILPNASVLEAVAQAGGFNVGASKGDILVVRRTAPDRVAVRKIGLKALLGGQAVPDMMLRRNDIVYVNRSAIGSVRALADNLLGPLLTTGDLYIRGWTIFNTRRVFPNQNPRTNANL